jgi:hypothetical protein
MTGNGAGGINCFGGGLPEKTASGKVLFASPRRVGF